MLILSRVCAEFRNRLGETVFSITPRNLLSFLEAPEEIQEDPLFSLMLRDGSLEAVRNVDRQRSLEADPLAGATPEGRRQSPPPVAAEAAGAEDAPASSPAEVAPDAPAAASGTASASDPAAAETAAPVPSGAAPAARRVRKAEK